MDKVKMPEPAAWMLAMQTIGGDIGWKLSWSQSGAGVCNRLSGESHETPLITTDQAEAYAAAKVREALEEAALVCEERSGDVRYVREREVYACADAIRALIPEQDKS